MPAERTRCLNRAARHARRSLVLRLAPFAALFALVARFTRAPARGARALASSSALSSATARAGTVALAERSAFVTYVMGDAHARMALALFQSLRDHNTSHELLALVGRKGAPSAETQECEARAASAAAIAANASTWIAAAASGAAASAALAPCVRVESLLSARYVQAFARLGVELRVAREVERSKYTNNIAGGPWAFWGAAYNKLQVLALTEFRRVVWMDSDTLALQSLDHLMLPSTPAGPRAFSAAFTIDCCVPRSPKMGGSLWVFEPSLALLERVLRKARQPAPDTVNGAWEQGDQRVVASAVGLPFARAGHYIESYPWLADYRQGLAPGLHFLPHHRGRTRAQVEEDISHTLGNRFARPLYDNHSFWTYTEGPLPRHMWPRCAASHDMDDADDAPVWRPLDARYDIMVGSCECVPHHDLAGRVEQDAVGVQMTAHFSCLKVPKPGTFEDERALLTFVYEKLPSCQRWYYLQWHAAFTRALGGTPLAPAYDGPPVPAINTSHDALFARRK